MSTKESLIQTRNNNDITSKNDGLCRQLINVPYNIKLLFIYSFVSRAGTSIWSSQLLSNYIYIISNDSTKVLGFIEATQGFMYLFSAPIVGVMIDKISSRIIICYIASILSLLVIICGIYITVFDNSKEFVYYIWLGFNGIASCFSMTITKTILADNTPPFQRDFIYSFNSIMRWSGNTIGPVIIVFMFYFLGDNWSLYQMNIVLLSGIILYIIPQILLCLFKTKPNVTKKSDNVDSLTNKYKISESLVSNNNDNNKKPSNRQNWVPWLLVLHRISIKTGAGMTVKFFPIYFQDILGLEPISLNLIFVIVPIISALSTLLCERFSNYIKNRIIIMILFKIIAVLCL